jgi:hypothetical protein
LPAPDLGVLAICILFQVSTADAGSRAQLSSSSDEGGAVCHAKVCCRLAEHKGANVNGRSKVGDGTMLRLFAGFMDDTGHISILEAHLFRTLRTVAR